MTKATVKYDPIVKKALESESVRRFVITPSRSRSGETASFTDKGRTVVVSTSPSRGKTNQ